jgi:hypothetical protein
MSMTPDHQSWTRLDQLMVETERLIAERGLERVVSSLLMQMGTGGRRMAFQKLRDASPAWRGEAPLVRETEAAA